MNIQKVLANAVVLGGFLVIPFIPLIVSGSSLFFPFITGKNFAFRVIVELMLCAYAVLAILDVSYRPQKSHILGAFGAFLGIITLSAIFGENPAKSFWSNFERMEGVVTYFHLFAYFIVASTVLTVRKLWPHFLNLTLVAGVIIAAYGVVQWAGGALITQGGTRVDGTLGNAAYMGVFSLFNIFIALFLLVGKSLTDFGGRVRIATYGGVALLHAFVLYQTATRGAMLGLLAGALLTAVLVAFFEGKNTKARKAAFIVLGGVVAVVFGFILVRDMAFVRESPVLNRFATISLTETTTKSRFMVWDMAYQGFKEKPLLGWGQENFNYVFNKYYDPNMWEQEQWFDRAHNVFFDWLIAGGFPALLAYLGLFGAAVYYIWRRKNTFSVLEKSILTGLLGGYFFQNLFVFDNITSLILFVTVLALVEGSARQDVVHTKQTEIAEDVRFVVGVLAIIGALILVYSVNYKGYMQNRTLLRALSEPSVRGPLHNLDLFKETFAYRSFGTAEAREQLAQLSIGSLNKKGLDPAVRAQFIKLAEDELKAQVEERPNDTRHQLFLGSFLLAIGKYQEASPYLKRAHQLSPKKQSIFFELARMYEYLGDTKSTEEVLKEAYELAPAYRDAVHLYAGAAIANKNYKQAEEVLSAHIERFALDIFAYAELAVLYRDLGRMKDFEATLDRANQVNPLYKAKIIENIGR